MSLLDGAGVLTGDIWCSGAFSFESPLKDLLDSGEYTLEQLLAEDELLQELRGVHPQLIEFFSTEQAVAGLVQYVSLPPGAPPPSPFVVSENATATDVTVAAREDEVTPQDDETKEDENGEQKEPPREETTQDDENSAETQQAEVDEMDAVHVRFPYMACEVICCEVKGVIDMLVDGCVPTNEDSLQSVVSADDADENAEVMLKDPRPPTILDLLFSMLYEAKAGEVDDYRAGYFDKILSVLFRKRPQALSQYINEGGGRGKDALMKVMFKHLYSHSIMQIVQRLLLPQPPLPPKIEDVDEEEKDGDDIYADHLDGGDIDGLGAFRCNWSQSEIALDLLLHCLILKSPFPEIENDEERRLSMYQNASEVLITIIQNSPLTSPILHALTTDPILEKLIRAASCVEEGDSFSPHDSRLTCTMNVLESLILQLGGYGSVGTVMFPEDEEDEEGELGGGGGGTGGVELENHESVEVKDGELPAHSGSMRLELASSDTLISHLPMMLSSLCNLLLYPGADNWLSPMQFSKTEPQKILGSSRLRIVRLLESLVLLGDPNVDTLLCGSNCLEICLDLFWKFQWCSMLHQSVANLLVHVFEGANARSELQSYFLIKCNLLGRLMDSFWEGADDGLASATAESEARLSEAVMAMKSENADVPTSSVQSEMGSTNSSDVLPVSDDDVDAALEQQEARKNGEGEAGTGGSEQVSQAEGSEGQGVADHTPSQSFRLGYMGHVIIICQALVHACTNDGRSEGPSVGGTSAGEPQPEMMNGELGHYVENHNEEEDEESPQEEGGALHNALERERAGESVYTDETPFNLLILAQLVDTHPFRNRWQDFVSTTLASETAIQSTPLGGFHGGSPGGMDPLHSHRPGLADDGDYSDEDGAAPPLPPRGLLVGGDVIDMDDNDLDVAASMMAGLSLGRPTEGGGEQPSHQDLLAGIPNQTGGGPPAGGYMFDDPLGDGRFGKFDDDDDSSSDEESEVSGNTADSGGAVSEGVTNDNQDNTEEAPVMDLFAGNFEAFDDKQDPASQQGANWSDFANFDDAFAGADGGSGGKNPAANGGVDDIFGDVKDHASLLEELDQPDSDAKDPDGAVAVKVNSVEDDSSSDEEEPVLENEETLSDS